MRTGLWSCTVVLNLSMPGNETSVKEFDLIFLPL